MEPLSFQEKKSLVGLTSTFLITILYGIYVYNSFLEADISDNNLFIFWGKTILYLFPVMIIFKIILYIVFNIINKIATKEDDPQFEDERDKLIDLKATRNSHIFFMLGFLFAIVSLVLKWPASAFFIILVVSMLFSCIVGDFSRICYYRRGV